MRSVVLHVYCRATLQLTLPCSPRELQVTTKPSQSSQLNLAGFLTACLGYLLDPFARHALWKDGLDFRHGTGHGVGSFLNVHEGPHGIGVRIAYNDTPLAAGMTVTDGESFLGTGG